MAVTKAAKVVAKAGRTLFQRAILQQKARVKVGATKVRTSAMMPRMRISEVLRVNLGEKAAARKEALRAKARKVGRTRKFPMLARWMMNWTSILAKSPRT